ncbi:MAG: gatB [Candidatus Taylorbacteria bacterium]|nr:gatB [Candidatus Taylorbacteria bacterium]
MNSEYIPTIGLEIHAELKTKSKMFCPCKNDPEEKNPNVNVCPICMGHPGTLPVPNKEAVKHTLKVGLAVEGTLADFSEFDRKNYFYPDIPKGYQISQYKYPFVSGGKIKVKIKENGVDITKDILLTRIHLEEDTAKSSHDTGDYSLVDYNRSSLPLMELVTEPVMHSGAEASAFAKEFQLILQYLGASDANMEKGEMRVEANISVSKDTNKLGTKVEVKNLNSFRSVERACVYEIERHIGVLENGETIQQETRGFDESTGKTFSQRKKEDSHDYRYFPEPDIPKLYISEISEFAEKELRKEMNELPRAKRERYEKEYGIKTEDIEFYVDNKNLSEFFEQTIQNFCDDKECVKLASNYIVSDLAGLMKNNNIAEPGQVFPSAFGKMMLMLRDGKLSSRGAKDILAILFKEGGDPEQIADEKGLIQKNDPEALKIIVEKVMNENHAIVAEYRAGKVAVLNSLVGLCMKESKGSGNPQLFKEIMLSILG